MKPAAFDYASPQTLDEALVLLAEHQPGARVLAGGQSLVPLLNMRAGAPALLVDINGTTGLDGVRQEDGQLVLGALMRQQQLATSQAIQSLCPLLTEAARKVAFPAIRNRGTLGGNLAHGEPGAQLPLALLTLDATVMAAHHTGAPRIVPLAELYRGPFATTLAADELLVEVRIPIPPPTVGYAVREYRRGHTGAPLIAVAAILDLAEDGMIRQARLSATGIDEVPLRLRAEEAALAGHRPTPAVWDAVAQRAAARVQRGDALLADVPLRRRITQTLVAHVLASSHQRALRGARMSEEGV